MLEDFFSDATLIPYITVVSSTQVFYASLMTAPECAQVWVS